MEKSKNFLIRESKISLQDKILEAVKKIPKGKVLTYKEVATRAGSPLAFWAVDNILNRNYNPGIPCHLVTRSNGRLGGYNRGRKQKIKLLKQEDFCSFSQARS